MTTQEALETLARTTADAVAEVLAGVAGEEVATTEVAVTPTGPDPLEGVAVPAVTVVADYDGSVQGGNVFVVPVAVAHRLAGLADDAELGEDDLAALYPTMTQVMAAVATATATALGEEIATQDPDVRLVRANGELKAGAPGATRATVAVITVFGEPCHLVQHVPTVFTMRMTQALTSEQAPGADPATTAALRDALRGVPLRVWAELGRARLRTVEVAALGDGSIVDLDHAADDPVDIYVNGSRIGTGRLIRLEESDWAVRLEQVFPIAEPGSPVEA